MKNLNAAEKTKARREFLMSTNPTLVKRRKMYGLAKARSKQKGIAFTITLEDIPAPTTCPILGIPLCWTNPAFLKDSPSLDKFDPRLGYVAGNINVISAFANMIKQDATYEEVLKVANWLKANQ